MPVAALAERKMALLEIRVGRDHYAPRRGNQDVVRARRARAAAQIDPDPGPRVDGRFRVLRSRLDRVGTAPEWHDAEYPWLLAREQLVRRGSVARTTRRPRGSVNTSTAIWTACVQWDEETLPAVRYDRVKLSTEPIARSATPFSACTWGGQVVWATSSASSMSVNWRDRNSPALSVWSEPTTRTGDADLLLAWALRDAMNLFTYLGASDLVLMKYTNLNLVWSSTMMRPYLDPPKNDGVKGPTMSACTSRPACVGAYCD